MTMNFSLKIDPVTGEKYMAVHQKGRELLLDAFTNKGTAFTNRERDELDLCGLLPPAVSTVGQQTDRCYEAYSSKTTNLEKFVYLASLQARNETLFYRFLLEHIDEMMPIVYTPIVGEACQKFSHIFRKSSGLYISYMHKGKIEHVLRNAYCEHLSVIVVTDGERILGLGDQGVGGMEISIGKLCLYTLCGALSPHSTLPIVLDIGTDNEERLKDPLYLGIRRKRMRGKEYQEFVDEFVDAVQKVFPHVLLQWEDFLKGNAIFQLNRFRDKLCTFNDDIQGTAAVVVSGIYTSLKISQKSLREQRLLIVGAGASSHGIADLFVMALMEEGLERDEAIKRIWTIDSRGLVTKNRGILDDFKKTYARDEGEVFGTTIEEIIKNVKPTILLGTSATPGLFTESVVKAMTKVNERPIIFPLSNPTSKCECVPEDVIRWSEGHVIIATGSPFPPVKYGNKTFKIGQGNNAYIFPGVGLGVTVGRVRRVTDGMFLAAAKALSEKVSNEDLEAGAVYPPLKHIRECSHSIACAVIRKAVEEGHADGEILEKLEQRVSSAMWYPEYLPIRYE